MFFMKTNTANAEADLLDRASRNILNMVPRNFEEVQMINEEKQLLKALRAERRAKMEADACSYRLVEIEPRKFVQLGNPDCDCKRCHEKNADLR